MSLRGTMYRVTRGRRPIIFFVLLILTTVVLLFFQPRQSIPPTSPTVRINNTSLLVEIADTDAERVQGLSGRPQLGADKGMLFVWDTPGLYGIWMKEMQFPIDIIWIGENKRIVDIVQNATPGSYPNIFQPTKPAQYVLEVNTGFVDQNAVQIGNTVMLSLSQHVP